MHVDLAFTVTTQRPVAADHGYALFSAVSRVLPELHEENGLAIHPLRGRKIGDGQMMLMPWSSLTLRTPADRIAPLLPLAGKTLRLGETALRIGVPQVHALEPAVTLRSRLTVIKVAHTSAEELTPENFLAAARKQLADLGISDQAQLLIPPRPTGPEQGQPMRRALTIKGAKIVGYELLIDGLTAAESLTLQQHGLGGRHHMGCGIFTPHTMPKETLQ